MIVNHRKVSIFSWWVQIKWLGERRNDVDANHKSRQKLHMMIHALYVDDFVLTGNTKANLIWNQRSYVKGTYSYLYCNSKYAYLFLKVFKFRMFLKSLWQAKMHALGTP